MMGGCRPSIPLTLLLCLAGIAGCEGHNVWEWQNRKFQKVGPDFTNPGDVRHGGVKMGVSNDQCDDGEHGIEIDWDPQSQEEYTCDLPAGQKLIRGPYPPGPPRQYCTNVEKKPLHKCLDEPIYYDEPIPLSGAHRPLWPVFGEYRYLPPQRWLHSLEHGSAVFLYHPCADPGEIILFKQIAQSCIRRHVITPYKLVDKNRPFVIVTYKCQLAMNYVDNKAARRFIQNHALKGPESEWENGQYAKGLLREAKVVSDEKDSKLCPESIQWFENDLEKEIEALEETRRVP